MVQPGHSILAAHPVDGALFGGMGATAAHVCQRIAPSFAGAEYRFMELDEFRSITDLRRRNQVYWTEMLGRVHLASGLNLMCHQRRQAGCIRAHESPSNYLSFSASLRGLIEGALDASYALMQVPLALAECRDVVQAAVRGELDELNMFPELEDRLIHFVYARKVAKEDRLKAPQHVVLSPKTTGTR